MIETEAREFVTDVLCGEWSTWKPTNWQIRNWTLVLKDFEYEASVQAVRNYSMTEERKFKEPNIAKIKRLLQAEKNKEMGLKNNEPVHLYTIVKESNLGKKKEVVMLDRDTISVNYEGGEKFFVGTPGQVPDEYEIERRAEQNRKAMTVITGENHVIKYQEIAGKAKT